MRRPRSALPSAVLVGCALGVAAPSAHAAGYFSGIKGARAAGRGGAFVAKADDLSAAWLNPAGLARLSGSSVQLGNRISHHHTQFVRQPTLDWGNVRGGIPPYVSFAAVENQAPWQALDPLLAAASNLGLEGWGFALAALAPGGVARQEFPIDGAQRYQMVQRDARLLKWVAAAAYAPNDRFSVGWSLEWLSVPRLSYQLVIDAIQFPGQVNPVRSELDMLATVSGSDPFTLQARIGAWYQPSRAFEIGFSAQVVPNRIHTQSTLSIEPLSAAVDDEVQLRRGGTPARDVRLSLPLPVTAQLGARYRHVAGNRELFDVELDVAYETWSRVDQFRLEGNGLTATLLAQTVDVSSIVIDKRWSDTLSFRLGGDYRVVPGGLHVRGGIFYDTAVARDAYAHVDFVSGTQLGAALGASVFMGNVELAFAHVYRVQPSRSVSEGEARVLQETPASSCPAPFTDAALCHPEFLGRGAPPINAGTYRAASSATSLDVRYRF